MDHPFSKMVCVKVGCGDLNYCCLSTLLGRVKSSEAAEEVLDVEDLEIVAEASEVEVVAEEVVEVEQLIGK